MKRILSIALMSIPAGCGVMRAADKPVTLRLAPAPPAAAPSLLPQSLAVAPVTARGMAGAVRYVYTDAAKPAELRQAVTLFWEEPPATVVQRALVAGLRTRFATVTGPEIGAPGAQRVLVRLDRFEERAAGGAARADVAFEAELPGAPLRIGEYCATAPVSGAAPSDRAGAFESAIATVVGAFVQDMAAGRLSATSC